MTQKRKKAKKDKNKRLKKLNRAKPHLRRRLTRAKTKKAIKKKAKKKTKATRPEMNFAINPQFPFFSELRDLVLKSLPGANQRLARRIQRLGRIKLAIISGVFLNLERPQTADLLLVGEDVEGVRLRRFLKFVESEVGGEIQFSLMNQEEFSYRRRMFDRFVRLMLEGPHEILINKLGI